MSEPVLLKTLKKIYGSIGSISGKKVLVIRELKTALLMAVRNSVVYITDDPECAELFRKNTEAGMGNDDIVVLINKWTNKLKFTKVFEKMGMKFDVAIMNPPYDRNLHLKILEAVIPHAEKVVNISPVRWLQDPFAPYLTRSDYCKFENSISKHIKELEVISAKNATDLFHEATFTMNLGIYTCDEQGGYNYTHNDPLITKIVEKTVSNSCSKFAYSKQIKNQQKQFQLINGCLGGVNQVMNSTYESQLNAKAPNPKAHDACNYMLISFETEEERKNFYDCYNTDFMKWHTSLWKTDVHVKPDKIPYFNDYTKPWTNEMFKKYFELTDDEWARIEREMLEMNQ